MKSLIRPIIIAILLYTPVVSFAQQNQPLTRDDVRSQLVQIEKAGYDKSLRGKDRDYPADIQAAETRVAAVNGETSSFGGNEGGLSESGSR